MTASPRPARWRRAAAIMLPLACAALLVAAFGVRVRKPAAPLPSQARAGDTATAARWRSVPQDQTLTRIGFGSCLDQKKPQPIWTDIIAARPQLFLMLGDNVYGDIKSPDLSELEIAYRDQLAHPEFGAARQGLAFLPMWDDHDYGRNDAGGDFEHREGSERLFRAFWQLPRAQTDGPGLAYARTFGPPGRRVQIIMLDARSFRSPLKVKAQTLNAWGKYEPDEDAGKTMLGAAQWAWLERELRRPAEVRLVVSGIQVLSQGHGFERWGNLPRERERLLRLIESTGASGTILLSGDRHMGAFYAGRLGNGQHLPEITSSSLNRSYGPSRDARTSELASDFYHVENFGIVDIDWEKARVRVALAGFGGATLHAKEYALADLAPAR